MTVTLTGHHTDFLNLTNLMLNARTPGAFSGPGLISGALTTTGNPAGVATFGFVSSYIEQDDTDFGNTSNFFRFEYPQLPQTGFVGIGAMLYEFQEASAPSTDNQYVEGLFASGFNHNVINRIDYVNEILTNASNGGLAEVGSSSYHVYGTDDSAPWSITGAAWNTFTFYSAAAAARNGNYTAWDQLMNSENWIYNGGALDDEFYGWNLADTLNGGGGSDALYGRGGKDTITGAGYLDGGDGDDTINAETSGTAVTVSIGGAGVDLMRGSNSTVAGDDMRGGADGDFMFGNNGNDLLAGGTGNDELYGGGGTDTLNGGDNEDVLDGGLGADTLNGDAGNDSFRDEGGVDGADIINGGAGFNTILFLGSAAVTVNTNNNQYAGNAAWQNIQGFIGTSGFDLIVLSDTDGVGNTIQGGAGNDILDGGAGADRIYGEGNDDTIYVGAGNDLVDGGANEDWLIVKGGSNFNSIWQIDASIGKIFHLDTTTQTVAATITFSNFEVIYGPDNVESVEFYGKNGRDVFRGGLGTENVFRAGLGNDEIYGKATSDDTMVMANSVTTVVAGQPFVIFGGNDVINMAAGTATRGVRPAGALSFSTETTIFSSIEGVSAGDGNDNITGSAAADYINAGTGNDAISGGYGTNTLVGDGGNDTAFYFTSSLGATRTHNANGSWTVSGIANGIAYSDTLTGVERIYFSSDNKTIALREAPKADITGDGKSEILLANAATGDVGYLTTNGSTSTWTYLQKGSATMRVAGSGDFNGDGTTDFLWQNPTNNFVGMWTMKNGAASWQQIETGSTTMKIAGVGDFNGDGTTDILWQNPTNNFVGMWQMNNGAATWVQIATGSTTMKIAGVGDFNGDGTSDILWQNPTNNFVGMWAMRNGVATWNAIATGSTTMGIVGTGDFDGDGDSDILWRNDTNGFVGYWEMTGSAPVWHQIGNSGPNLRVAATGDYNNDGTTDILWRDPGTGLTGTWLMNDGTPTWNLLGGTTASYDVIM